MDTPTSKFKIRLGLFITIGLLLFIMAIFIIGKQKHVFDPVFRITTTFSNISGLQIGCNIRYSGITVGTVDNISIIDDSTVQVDMIIKKSVQKFIKADCQAAIGSSGLIGDRILTITQGTDSASPVKEGEHIASKEPVEIDAIISNLKVTTDNVIVISELITEIVGKINSGKGTLGKLIQDSTIAENIKQTIVNLESGSKSLDENMSAAKENILLKGYFNRKEKVAERAKEDSLKILEENQKTIEKANKKSQE